LPLAAHPQAHEERDHEREQGDEPPGVRLELHPVALDDLLFRGQRRIARGHLANDPQVDPQSGEEDEAERQPQHRARLQHLPEDLGETDLAEPQHIDEEPRERREREQQSGQHRHDDDDDPAAAGDRRR
jgi:hypothetical protein